MRAETFDAGGQRHTVQVYRNDAFANALGLDDDETDLAAEFVLIPAGQLTQGDPERGGQRTVDVKSFLLARTPVTQRVWRGLLGEARLPWSPSRFGGGRRPVERVHWFDARTWCETNGLRLPSDDEWEYACRAGTTTRYYFGDDEEELEEYAWYAGNSRERTHNVGGKSTNAFGLHDMHGNVWEWVDTLYVEQLQRRNKQPEEIQCNGGERPGVRAAPLSTWRITRGGGWDTPARRCRSTVDHARQPGHRGANLGFRAAASLP